MIIIFKNDRHDHYKAREHNGICVVARRGESTEDLIKRFKKKFTKSGLLKELREKMFYEKPSDRKRRKKAQSIRLLQKEEEKIEKMKERAKKYKEKQKKIKNKEMKRRQKSNDKSSGK